MRKLMNWGQSQGAWNGSGLDLPSLDGAADPAQQRWCAVAGGLALILSRVSASERVARFQCTHALYAHIRRCLRESQPVAAAIELVSETMHEVADIADPLTRRCLKACFQAGLRGAAETGATQQSSPETASSLSVRAPSSRPSSMQGGASTGFTSELLMERSAALRRKLAAARSTSFADLK